MKVVNKFVSVLLCFVLLQRIICARSDLRFLGLKLCALWFDSKFVRGTIKSGFIELQCFRGWSPVLLVMVSI